MNTAKQNFREAPEAAATPASALIAFVLGFTGFPAIIIGHIALARIKNSQRKLNGRFFAIAGIVMGWLSMIAVVIVTALIALGITAIPKSVAASDKINNEAALTTATELKSSLDAYYAEYQSYPFPKSFAVGQSANSNADLMMVLMGKESIEIDRLNISNTEFFSAKQAKPNWFGTMVNGMTKSGDLYDPWGSPYYIKLNAKTPGNETVTATVWSSGKDRKDGTHDDILLAN